MKNIFSLKSIRGKVLGGFFIVLLLTSVLGVLSYLGLAESRSSIENLVDEQLPILIADETATARNFQRLQAASTYLLTGDEQFKANYDRYTEESLAAQAIILEANDSEEVRELFARSKEWNDIIVNEVVAVYDEGNQEEAFRIFQERAAPIGEELTERFQEMVTAREVLMTETGQDSVADGENILQIFIYIILFIIVISIVISFIIANVISKPIVKVVGRVKEIAGGDLTQEDLDITTKDETAELTIATNELSKNIREIMNDVQMMSHTVSSQSEELTQSSNEVMEGTEQIASTMEEIAAGSEAQARNASDISANMATFTEKIQETDEDGEEVRVASSRVLDMADEGAELMRSSMEQMTKIDEMVQQAVERVEGLDSHTQEISQLVAIIQDIADQTNLLALNASIEAARAGEQGKGFAVVADEVGKLAEQSSHSVTNITDIVNQIQAESSHVAEALKDGYTDVTEGAKQIGTTGETFEQIRAAISDAVDGITQVTNNLTGLAGNTAGVNTTIQEIAAVSEESAAGIEETTAATEQTLSSMHQVAASSEDLAKLADELDDLVQRFKI